MHILMMTAIGLAVFTAFAWSAGVLGKRRSGRCAIDGALPFVGLWFVVSAIDFGVGVFGAGYSVLAELGAHAIIFGVPAGVAWCCSRRHGARGSAGRRHRLSYDPIRGSTRTPVCPAAQQAP